MTEFDAEHSPELAEAIEKKCLQHLENAFDYGHETEDIVNLLEEDFPDVDRELLETIAYEMENSVRSDADKATLLLGWFGGEGVWGSIGKSVGFVKEDKDLRIIWYPEYGPGVQDMFRCSQKEFKKLSKEQTSLFLLSYLTALTNLEGGFAAGLYRIDLDYIREEDADPVFAAMKARKDGDGDYYLKGDIYGEKPTQELLDRFAELNALARDLPLKNLLKES